MNPRLKEVEVLEDYQLLLTFKNGEKRIYDAKKLFQYDFFKNIKNKENFEKVKVADGITTEWESGEDVDPDELYVNSIPIKQ